jgi:glutaconate CoA-transferase subunit A
MGVLVSMEEAIRRFVRDGDAVALGTGLESLIPFAAGHEIIRQGRRDLTLIGPISDVLFDQLIGAGCAARVVAAWVGNVSEGLGHAYRRAVERGEPRPVAVEDHSNFSLALGLLAGGLGVPFVPTRSLLGTDLLRSNPRFRVWDDPASGERLVLVPAIAPDVTVLHCQRSDPAGNAHTWGNLGVSEEAALAARRVIVVAEEMVDPKVIRSDPNRIVVPAPKVCAVVHEPWGAHPSPVQGCYDRDHAFFREYHAGSRTPDRLRAWLEHWVYGPTDRQAYVRLLGPERCNALRVKQHRYAAPVDYGF